MASYLGYVILFFSFSLFEHVKCAENEENVDREGKLFYVTTSSSVSTISTHSTCYVSDAAFTGTCGRRKKRRSVIRDEAVVQPKIDVNHLDSSMDDANEVGQRNAKFLVYWLTTTSTSTTTVFTATSTLATLTCTPALLMVRLTPGVSLVNTYHW